MTSRNHRPMGRGLDPGHGFEDSRDAAGGFSAYEAEDVVHFYEEVVRPAKPAVAAPALAVAQVQRLLREGQDRLSLQALALAYASFCNRRGLPPSGRASAEAFYALATPEWVEEFERSHGRAGCRG